MNNKIAHNLFITLAVCISIFLSSCGGDNSIGFTEVKEVSLRDSTTPANGTNNVRTKFSVRGIFVSTDPDGTEEFTSEAFSLLVFLPVAVQYLENSSKVTDSLFGDVLFGNPDPREPNARGVCDDGRQFVQYNFKEGEFGDPSEGGVTLYAKFDVGLPQVVDGGEISATTAFYKINDPCTELGSAFTTIKIGS